ncbi:hypothetical protein pb186bvf_015007 [Paramecium bursaria]
MLFILLQFCRIKNKQKNYTKKKKKIIKKMGCNVSKQNQNKSIKQYDPKLNQMVQVPVLFNANSNPIVRRRQQDLPENSNT